MSSDQHHVSPKLPTALAGHATHLDLPGHDVLLLMLQNVHIVSTKVDVPTFEEALSKTLQLYPHAAGQLRYSGDRWFFELTNSAVPIDVDYKLDTTSDALLNGDWVVQDDLSMFINHQPINLGPTTDADAPLVRLKLTLFEDETAIGITWHHALGDAILMLRFMHTLSQFYQGLPPTYPPPTFEKHHFPPPSASITDEFWPLLSHLHFTCPLSEFRQVYGGFLRHFQDLKWRFDDDELARLRSTLTLRAQDQSYLSKQDCLTAYVVAVLNRSGESVQTVASVSSYRDIDAPFAAANGAGNMIQNISATVPWDMADIATALRRALQKCRDPQYIEHAMAVSSEKMLEIARAGRGVNWTVCDDGLVTVNSNVAIDWCSAHFGCADGSRFYTTRTLKHWLRCFRSNPAKGEDGVWRARQSIDSSMGVSPEVKSRMLKALARGFENILDDEDPNV